MPALSEQDRLRIQTNLARMAHPVTLLLFTQTIESPETGRIARRLLDEIAALGEKIGVEEVNVVLEAERAARYGVEAVPAIVLLKNGADARMRFLGTPAGYELQSLVDAIVLAGSDESGLSALSKRRIAELVTSPLDIQVFVTPTCAHCPRAVTLAHRMAVESPYVRATCVEATAFLDLSRKYRVTGVPKTVVNGSIEILGPLPEQAFVDAIVGPSSGRL